MLNQEKIVYTLPWLDALRSELRGLLQAGRCPHALLLHGRVGTGRRQLALTFAETMLGTDPLRTIADTDEALGHPDLLVVEPPEGKAIIGVAQIRELVDFFHLTSHSGAGRLAVIWPAESMNASAANSLLKTLEEPPAGSVLILITESLARLPATVVSRCQRVRVPLPSRAAALSWLEAASGGAKLADVLDFAGGAPLEALQLHTTGFVEIADGFARDIDDLQRRQANPVEVAGRWNKHPDMALDWLAWRVAAELRALFSTRSADSATRQAWISACLAQLEQIRELRRVFKGGISTELSLAGLLTGWYGGRGH